MESDFKERALAKIQELKKELGCLVNQDYVPDMTVADDKEIATFNLTPEYEFSESYTDPKRAVDIIVECYQLEREVKGLPRFKIVTTEQAAKIIEKNQSEATQERTIRIESNFIKTLPPKAIQIPANL